MVFAFVAHTHDTVSLIKHDWNEHILIFHLSVICRIRKMTFFQEIVAWNISTVCLNITAMIFITYYHPLCYVSYGS